MTTRIPCRALLCLLLLGGASFAEEKSTSAPDDATELAKKLQNPVADLISVPFQSNFEWGAGPHSRGFKYTLNFQPVVPISISKDWNVISRTIAPIIYQAEVVPESTQRGLGDTTESLFLSPKAPGPGGIIWGAGPIILLPTSTEDFLGAQKWGLGPTVVLLRQHDGWTYGILANHLWSIGGTHATETVNSTYLQPFMSYTAKTHTSFIVNTESTYDWTDTKWTIPLNPSVSQVLKVADQPISLQAGPKLYVEGPTSAPDWGMRFTLTFLFPR